MPNEVILRPPNQVMRLAQLGAAFPTRLSFLRRLLRILKKQQVSVERKIWQMNAQGYGHAVYTLVLGKNAYSLIAFSTPIKDEERSDRVVATVWDTSYVLFDGIPNISDIERLKIQVPLQEAGRFTASELVLCRANRSVRFFAHVVDCLAQGRQPDQQLMLKTGYLLRTTAVYGNGKFGIADRQLIAQRKFLSQPFCAEMLTVWLIRDFSHDLVEHIASRRVPETAVKLEEATKIAIGVGNSTGLGMAPFIINHPLLLNNWILAREKALGLLRVKQKFTHDDAIRFYHLIEHVTQHLCQWQVDDDMMQARNQTLCEEWEKAKKTLFTKAFLECSYPIDKLLRHSLEFSIDFQELLVSLLIEFSGEVVDFLAEEMSAEELGWIMPGETIGSLKRTVHDYYKFALQIDFERPQAKHYFWYVSEEKLEPRLGVRGEEDGDDQETPLDIARQLVHLASSLEEYADDKTVAQFLCHNPHHRTIIKRVQHIKTHPYMEIQDNLIGENCFPIDLLRLKLSFFGASKFDPRSDRWTRITLFQGAPCAKNLAKEETYNTWLPVI